MADQSSQALSSVQLVAARFEELRIKARETKQLNTIEPPLAAADFAADFEELKQEFGGGDSQWLIIENVAQEMFYDILVNTNIEDPEFVRMWDLLDLLQIGSDLGQCQPQEVVRLVELLIDSQTTAGCRIVFDYLESRSGRIFANDFDKKKFSTLRFCNELLRRLSRAEDAVFCGRVFFFLFQNFPLGDKSSVNLRGTFHIANVTTWDENTTIADSESAANGGGDDVRMENADGPGIVSELNDLENPNPAVQVTGADGQATTGTPKVSAAAINSFYPTFWRMQQDYAYPPRLFEGKNLETFQNTLQQTLDTFKSVPTVMQKAQSEGERGLKRREDGSPVDNEYVSSYNPKYLTSKDLFKLELSDLAFQRHILVQALILLDFLLSLTEKAKARLAKLTPQKAMIYDFTLTEKDATWVTNMRDQIANYLQAGPEGRFFYRMVDTVLSRDRNWVRWKAQNCQPIARDPLPASHYLEARQGAAKACAPKRLRSAPMGGLDLGFLTETGNNEGLNELKNPARYQIPSIGDFEKRIANAELDLDFADNDEQKENLENVKSSNTWRALRVASRNHLDVFDKLEDGRKLSLLTATGTTITTTTSMDEVNGIDSAESREEVTAV